VYHRARDEAGNAPVRESGNGVRLHHHYGLATQNCRDHRRSGHVSARAEDCGGLARELHTASRDKRESGDRSELLGEADAVESANFDLAKLEAFGWDKPAF